MRLLITLCVVVLTLSVCAEEQVNVAEMALSIVKTHVPADEWTALQKQADTHYESWSQDNQSGSFKRFLDDKMLEITTKVPTDTKTLRRYVCWLALYAVKHEPTPSYIQDMKDTYKQEIDKLLTDFSWDKALDKLQTVVEASSKKQKGDAKTK